MTKQDAKRPTLTLRSWDLVAPEDRTENRRAQELLEDGTPEQALATAEAWTAIAKRDADNGVDGAEEAAEFWADVAALLRLETQNDEPSDDDSWDEDSWFDGVDRIPY